MSCCEPAWHPCSRVGIHQLLQPFALAVLLYAFLQACSEQLLLLVPPGSPAIASPAVAATAAAAAQQHVQIKSLGY